MQITYIFEIKIKISLQNLFKKCFRFYLKFLFRKITKIKSFNLIRKKNLFLINGDNYFLIFKAYKRSLKIKCINNFNEKFFRFVNQFIGDI